MSYIPLNYSSNYHKRDRLRWRDVQRKTETWREGGREVKEKNNHAKE